MQGHHHRHASLCGFLNACRREIHEVMKVHDLWTNTIQELPKALGNYWIQVTVGKRREARKGVVDPRYWETLVADRIHRVFRSVRVIHAGEDLNLVPAT